MTSTVPAVNLKERIAALQQRNASPLTPQHTGNSSDVSSPPRGTLRDKIAKFEQKGGTPIPRGSFGLGAPPSAQEDEAAKRKGQMYGNRLKSLTKPVGPPPVRRSSSTLSSSGSSKQRCVSASFADSYDAMAYMDSNPPSPSLTAISGADELPSPTMFSETSTFSPSPRRNSFGATKSGSEPLFEYDDTISSKLGPIASPPAVEETLDLDPPSIVISGQHPAEDDPAVTTVTVTPMNSVAMDDISESPISEPVGTTSLEGVDIQPTVAAEVEAPEPEPTASTDLATVQEALTFDPQDDNGGILNDSAATHAEDTAEDQYKAPLASPVQPAQSELDELRALDQNFPRPELSSSLLSMSGEVRDTTVEVSSQSQRKDAVEDCSTIASPPPAEATVITPVHVDTPTILFPPVEGPRTPTVATSTSSEGESSSIPSPTSSTVLPKGPPAPIQSKAPQMSVRAAPDSPVWAPPVAPIAFHATVYGKTTEVASEMPSKLAPPPHIRGQLVEPASPSLNRELSALLAEAVQMEELLGLDSPSREMTSLASSLNVPGLGSTLEEGGSGLSSDDVPPTPPPKSPSARYSRFNSLRSFVGGSRQRTPSRHGISISEDPSSTLHPSSSEHIDASSSTSSPPERRLSRAGSLASRILSSPRRASHSESDYDGSSTHLSPPRSPSRRYSRSSSSQVDLDEFPSVPKNDTPSLVQKRSLLSLRRRGTSPPPVVHHAKAPEPLRLALHEDGQERDDGSLWASSVLSLTGDS